MSKILYGLANPKMDEVLEAEIRAKNPNSSDNQVLMEMNRLKKELTFFNEKNSKSNSTRRPSVSTATRGNS